MNRGRKKIGSIGVDSGGVIVGDPCYLRDWKANEFDVVDGDEYCGPYTYDYDGSCRARLSEDAAGELGSQLAVAVTSGYGDGQYDVFVEYEDGRPARLIVEFMPKEEDDRGAWGTEEERARWQS